MSRSPTGLSPPSRPDRLALTTCATRALLHEGGRSDGIFPLPLSPFEHLFLLDESPSYPMQFFCRLRFRGRLRQQTLITGLSIAQARHPLLSAIVDESQDRGPLWQPYSNPLPQVQWLEQEPNNSLPSVGALDLRTQPGLKLIAVVGASTSDLVVQFHHAACDGLGALDFITDLLTAYANAASGTNRYRLKPLDVQRLRSRGDVPLSGRQLFQWGMRQASRLWPLWRFFRRRPVPLLPHRPSFDDPAPPPSFPESWTHHFNLEESAALAALARGSQCSLNALLMRDLFLALHQWRTQQRFDTDNWLRLMVPINMRTPGDRRLPAANVVSLIFMDQCCVAGFDAAALLQKTNRLMADIKRHDLARAWQLALPVLQRLARGWANARRSRRRCQYSALFTNLGPVLAAAPLPRAERRLVVHDLTLNAVEFVPTTRPLQCVGISFSIYAGRMTLTLRYDSRVLRPEQAQAVLDCYVSALGRSIETAPNIYRWLPHQSEDRSLR